MHGSYDGNDGPDPMMMGMDPMMMGMGPDMGAGGMGCMVIQ